MEPMGWIWLALAFMIVFLLSTLFCVAVLAYRIFAGVNKTPADDAIKAAERPSKAGKGKVPTEATSSAADLGKAESRAGEGDLDVEEEDENDQAPASKATVSHVSSRKVIGRRDKEGAVKGRRTKVAPEARGGVQTIETEIIEEVVYDTGNQGELYEVNKRAGWWKRVKQLVSEVISNKTDEEEVQA
ncbi:unnamed protein product [Cyprideis torosa]|uniref:Uncharacterized protein n=1 Tax=Cyprideis torosa TaxID=163714 RepID=A0A7R8W443_9CRUS|nr:unnamed protein product [Cyprideis torosa]CAG0879242.1 unnamed protein product [Cyprideis torosa]